MQEAVHACRTASNPWVTSLENVTVERARRYLKTGNQAATLDQLFRSQHVEDLRLIVASAILVAYAIILAVVIHAVMHVLVWICSHHSSTLEVASNSSDIDAAVVSGQSFLHSIASFSYYMILNVGRDLRVAAPGFVVLGGVLTWAYQVGSARLGVVDLFACEISTLCRVAATVDVVHRYVEKFREGPAAEISSAGVDEFVSRPFTSEENYFPVFQGNSRDLEALEARVVVYITQFYTYMKAVRDMQRALARIKPQPAESGPLALSVGAWHEAVRNIVYMMFLAMESARHAIDKLVEFESENAERTIVILISELEAYRFLCGQFPEGDVRHDRILMREGEYRKVVQPLIDWVKTNRGEEKNAEAQGRLPLPGTSWEPAYLLLPELNERYELALPGRSQPAVEPLPAVVDDERGVEDLVTSAVSTRLGPV